MSKTIKMLKENLSLVDVVIEIIDARIPYSSKNPDIDRLAANKHRILVLNKVDLADDAATAKWRSYYMSRGFNVIAANSVSGKGMDEAVRMSNELLADKIESLKKRGRISYTIRAMVVGIPNVGKSTFINMCVGKASAKTADRPGVTRGKQWIKIKNNFDLLDTPGILWPKFDDKSVGVKLALTGAVNDNITDTTALACELINLLPRELLKKRYNADFPEEAPVAEILEMIALSRGFLLKGGKPDSERASVILIDEFRAAKLGKFTLE